MAGRPAGSGKYKADPRRSKHVENEGTAHTKARCADSDLDVEVLSANGPVDYKVKLRAPPRRHEDVQQKTFVVTPDNKELDPRTTFNAGAGTFEGYFFSGVGVLLLQVFLISCSLMSSFHSDPGTIVECYLLDLHQVAARRLLAYFQNSIRLSLSDFREHFKIFRVDDVGVAMRQVLVDPHRHVFSKEQRQELQRYSDKMKAVQRRGTGDHLCLSSALHSEVRDLRRDKRKALEGANLIKKKVPRGVVEYEYRLVQSLFGNTISSRAEAVFEECYLLAEYGYYRPGMADERFRTAAQLKARKERELAELHWSASFKAKEKEDQATLSRKVKAERETYLLTRARARALQLEQQQEENKQG